MMMAKAQDLFKYITLERTETPLVDPPKVESPPYCPNPQCKHHGGSDQIFFTKNGKTKTEKYPYVNQRYRCKSCGKYFSDNTFSMDFRKKFIGMGPLILEAISNSMTYRSLGRVLRLSEHTIRKRVTDLTKQALIREKQLTRFLEIDEEIAYDGFEGFCHSQFSPCYINTAVGRDSFYTYLSTYSPLNRKGRMTAWQKRKNAELVKCFGPYPRNSVQKESEYIFSKLKNKTSGPLIIWTDQHKSYGRAAQKHPEIILKTISSKARRDASNPLFAVNHLHMTFRHFNSAHRRETIAFHKNEAGLMDKVHLIRIHKNFFRSKFSKSNYLDERADQESPAMKIGIANEIMNFYTFFRFREMASRVKFDQKEEEIFNRSYPYSRHKIN